MEFGKTDENFIDDVKKSLDAGGWKPKMGRNTIRILPPAAGRTKPWVRFSRHYCFHVGGEWKDFVCPTTIDPTRSCPICEHVEKLYKTNESSNVAIAKAIRAKPRAILNILDMEAKDRGPQIWDITATRNYDFEKISNIYASWGQIHDPDTGHALSVVRSVQGEFTVNDIQVVPKGSGPLPPDVVNNPEFKLTDLETYLEVCSDAALKAAIPFASVRTDFSKQTVSSSSAPTQVQSTLTAQTAPVDRVPKCVYKGLYDATEEECTSCTVKAQCQANSSTTSEVAQKTVVEDKAKTPAAPASTPEVPKAAPTANTSELDSLEQELRASMNTDTETAS